MGEARSADSGLCPEPRISTVVTLVAMSHARSWGLTTRPAGLVGAAFHITFGVMQLPMGVALDLYGPRRVVAAVFPVAVGGAILTVLSSDAQSLVAGQLLIGLGCSPVFLAALVIIGRSYPPEQFSRLSGIVLGVSGAGMLITGTPLAWVADAWSWRAAYLVLTRPLSGGMVLALLRFPPSRPSRTGKVGCSLPRCSRRRRSSLSPRPWASSPWVRSPYASFISLRDLWLVPLLTDRHGLTLIESGHVALAGSIVVLLAPPLFGRVDPGGRKRRRLIVGCTIVYAGLFALLASGNVCNQRHSVDRDSEWAGWLLRAPIRGRTVILCTGCVRARIGGLQYVDVSRCGWMSGLAASAASERGMDPLVPPLWVISVLLLTGAGAFVFLPSSKHSRNEGATKPAS